VTSVKTFVIAAAVSLGAEPLPYDAMAARVVSALKVAPRERVMLRLNPAVMPELEPAVRRALERAGAAVDTVKGEAVDGFEQRLAQADIYVWLPGASMVTTPEQRFALARWVDAGGGRRELHFHWSEGTLGRDGEPIPHTAVHDRLYLDALNIEYAALGQRMDHAIALLRSGEVRVTTPAGTDIRFRVGDRPFNKQDGDGSRPRAERGRIRIDRHIELPAGVLRVAPVEESVSGTMVLPALRRPDTTAAGVRLEFERGRIVRFDAQEGRAALDAIFNKSDAASRFREFCLGFNPKLQPPPGETTIPYYGYGDGVVRMSLGDNEELGGAVRGGFVWWLFFVDATVEVNGQTLVRSGRLTPR
jgi:hypothetical protein